MILASQQHLTTEPLNRKRTFLLVSATLQTALLLAFTAPDLIIFYIIFEATLVPTLILITRWGNQAERLAAGTYFLFYTLVGSLPLLVALLIIYANNSHSLILLIVLKQKILAPAYTSALL